MYGILQGVEGVAYYIDDIIVTGRTHAEHLEHLEEVLKCLLRHRVQVKQSKCQLLQSRACFFGHHSDAEGIHPLQDKLIVFMLTTTPQNVQKLHSFSKLIN